jgi:hypothetical protein
MPIQNFPSSQQSPGLRPQAEVWTDWEELARAVLVDAMKQRRMSYKALSRELESLGIYETPDRLNRKVNRGKFSAAFWLACCKAMNVEVTLVSPP